MPASSAQEPESSGQLVFFCPQCGKKLTVSHRLAGVSGPCPSCAAVIRAPEPSTAVTGEPSIRRDPSSAIQGRKSAPRRSKGHIVADSIVDRGHQDLRETAKTLFIIMMFILAICACLLVSWFLNVWVKK